MTQLHCPRILSHRLNAFTALSSTVGMQVHINDWGTLSTISRDLSAPSKPVPYGSTVSFSDGPLNRSTGRLLFYLTLLDAAAYDLQAEKVATLAVAEAQVYGSCGVTDPEVMLSGWCSITLADA